MSDPSHQKKGMAFSTSVMEHDTKGKESLLIPDFNNNRLAFENKSTASLLRAYLVFNLCRIKPLVRNAGPLLNLTRRVFGDSITDTLLKSTLFGHFCAGEDEKRLQPAIADMRRNGIGGILDYAAESDVPTTTNYSQPAREYSYESEAACDRHVDIFRSCIRSVANVTPDGFAAIKVTALGNPLLLERVSQAIVETKNLFAKFDLNEDGHISRDEFERAHR
jgi:proline dehydrogenase